MFKVNKKTDYYDKIGKDIIPFIEIDKNKFNKMDKDIRDTIVECAIRRKADIDKNKSKILFSHVPKEVKNIITKLGVSKEIFEVLDIFPQQLIINYSYKISEINKKESFKKKNKYKEYQISEWNLDKWFYEWFNHSIVVSNNIKLEKIMLFIKTIEDQLSKYNRKVRNLKNNLKYNNNMYNTINSKKDPEHYQKKIVKYQEELILEERDYTTLKNIYTILKTIVSVNLSY